MKAINEFEALLENSVKDLMENEVKNKTLISEYTGFLKRLKDIELEQKKKIDSLKEIAMDMSNSGSYKEVDGLIIKLQKQLNK